MKKIRLILFAGVLGLVAGMPALADHCVGTRDCNDCNDCRPRHRLFHRGCDDTSDCNDGRPRHRLFHRGCEDCDKVCVPNLEKVKVTKAIYECKCVDFCLPGHPGRCFTPLSHGCKDDCGDCGGCAPKTDCDDGDCAPKCDKLRTRKVLIKRFKTEEKDVWKCVPEVKPCIVSEQVISQEQIICPAPAPHCPAPGAVCPAPQGGVIYTQPGRSGDVIIVQPAPTGKPSQPVEIVPPPVEKKK
jgi:hypothetical protein